MSGKGTGWISVVALVGLVAGGFLGYHFPSVMGLIGVFGKFFVYALVIAAFIQFATSSLLASEQIGQRTKLVRITLRVVGLYLLMGLAGGLIGLLAAGLISPGQGVNQIVSDLHQGWAPLTGFSLSPALLGGFILLVISLSAGVVGLGARYRAVSNSVEQIHQIASKSVDMLTFALPFGLFALAAGLVGSDDMLRTSIAAVTGAGPAAASMMMNSVWGYFGLVTVGLLIIGFVLLPVALRLFGSLPVGSVLGNLGPAMTAAFGSGASLIAYPMLQTALTDRLKTDNRVAGLVLPLGNLLNVTATCFVTVVAVVFMAQTAGIELTVVQYLAILIAPLFIAIGRVGLPAMTAVTLTAMVAILGFSVEVVAGMGMVLIVDWLVDRVRAVVNVMSDATVVAIAGEFFEFKTARAGREVQRPQEPARGRRDFSRGRPDRSGPDNRRFDRPDGRSDGRSDERSDGRSDARRGRDSRPQERRQTARQSERPSPRKEADDRQRDSRGRSRTPEISPFEMNAEQSPQFDVDFSKKPTAPAPKRSYEKRVPESPAPQPERRKTPRSSDPGPDKRDRVSARGKTEPEKTGDSPAPSSRPRTRTRRKPEAVTPDVSRIDIHHDPVGEELLNDKVDAVDNRAEKPVAEPSPAKKSAPEIATGETEKSQLTIDLSTMNGSGTLRAVAESDYTTQDFEMPVKAEASIDKPSRVEPDKVTEEPADEPAAPKFGRSRSRRGEKPKPEAESSESSGGDQAPKDAFIQGEVSSFGRGKRKRTR